MNLQSRSPGEAQRNPEIDDTVGHISGVFLQETNNHFRGSLLVDDETRADRYIREANSSRRFGKDYPSTRPYRDGA